jgi:RHS repeat-associated protein
LNDVGTALPVVLQELGPDGPISYAYGLSRVSESGNGFDYFYHVDGLGSTVGLTDAVGKLRKRYAYDAWGRTTQSVPLPKVGTENKFGFTGEALDPASGLYYLRARYYDSNSGRLMTTDPIGGTIINPLTLNRYIYALSNPIRYTDPSGKDPWDSLFNWCSSFWDWCGSVADSTQKAQEYRACTVDIGNSSNGCNNGLPQSVSKTSTSVTAAGVNVTIGLETSPATYGLPSLPMQWWVKAVPFLIDLFTPKVAQAAGFSAPSGQQVPSQPQLPRAAPSASSLFGLQGSVTQFK